MECQIFMIHFKYGQREGGPLCRSLKFRKMWLGFGKTCPNYAYLCIKILILNTFLGVCGRKIHTFFHEGIFFHVLVMKCLWKCPYSKKHSLPSKVDGFAPGKQPSFSSFLFHDFIFNCDIGTVPVDINFLNNGTIRTIFW